MFAVLVYNLKALRSVTGAQIKANYDALKTLINGGLSAENFAPRAGFTNAQKEKPRGWFVLSDQWLHPAKGDGSTGTATAQYQGTSVLRWKIPEYAPSSRKSTMKVRHWSAWIGEVNVGSVTGGTAKLRHTVASTGVTTDKDTFSLANPQAKGRLLYRDVTEFTVSPGDTLEVQLTGVTYSGGGTWIRGFGAAVWLRMNHVP
ncbi:MAG: hypothetical protein ACM3UX_00600 [Candidatus Woesearchaeota archaeon]